MVVPSDVNPSINPAAWIPGQARDDGEDGEARCVVRDAAIGPLLTMLEVCVL
jgi:hypothetical protein